MSKTLDIIHEAVVNKHRARNEAIKRILTRHKTGIINQSVANQQLKSCGHPGLNMEELIPEDYESKTEGKHTHIFHDDVKIGTITHKKPSSYKGVHHPTGKEFNTGSLSHAMSTIHKLHSSHNRFNESVEDPHHGFKPDQMIKRKHEGEIKDARYLGPHHNKEYAKIISHNGKKITDRWENLIKESLPSTASSSDYVDDFVHSKNKMFKGDSKKQRIRRALGAYYSKHKK
jgi:hypothetical protein